MREKGFHILSSTIKIILTSYVKKSARSTGLAKGTLAMFAPLTSSWQKFVSKLYGLYRPSCLKKI